MVDAFISYSRADGAEASSEIELVLAKAGASYWKDERDLTVGEDFTAAIEQAIEDANAVIVCITSDSKNPDSFVRREIQYALVLNKPVIPIRFESIAPPISIVTLPWIDAFAPDIEWNRKLTEWIEQICAEPTMQPNLIPIEPHYDYLSELYKGIVDVLASSVHHELSISLQGQAHSSPLINQLYSAQRIDGGSAIDVETHSSFKDAFEEHDRRVFLLGEPGSGKTVTLLAFVRDLIAERLSDPSKPLPLLGIIPSWRWGSGGDRELISWLAAGSDHLTGVAVEQAVHSENVTVVLDGLDELGERVSLKLDDIFDPRMRFLQLVDEQLSSALPLAISSRVVEFEATQTSLAVSRRRARENPEIAWRHAHLMAPLASVADIGSAVSLQELSDAQIATYLADKPALFKAANADPDFKEMLRTPLVLSLFMAVMDFEDLEARSSGTMTPMDRPTLLHSVIESYIRQRHNWEAARCTGLPDVDELIASLGQVALRDAATVTRASGAIVLEPDIVEGARTLNLIVQRTPDTYRFVHLMFRDFFAAKAALNAGAWDRPFSDRLGSAYVLGRSELSQAVPVLFSMFEDKNPAVRRAAELAIVELRKSEASSLIDRQLEVALASESDRSILSALSALGDDETHIRANAVSRHLTSSSPVVRSTALFALSRLDEDATAIAIRDMKIGDSNLLAETVRVVQLRLRG